MWRRLRTETASFDSFIPKYFFIVLSHPLSITPASEKLVEVPTLPPLARLFTYVIVSSRWVGHESHEKGRIVGRLQNGGWFC